MTAKAKARSFSLSKVVRSPRQLQDRCNVSALPSLPSTPSTAASLAGGSSPSRAILSPELADSPSSPLSTASSSPFSPGLRLAAADETPSSPLSPASPTFSGMRRASATSRILPSLNSKRSTGQAKAAKTSLKASTSMGFKPAKMQMERLGSSSQLRGVGQERLARALNFSAAFDSRDDRPELEAEPGESIHGEAVPSAKDAVWAKRDGEAVWVLKHLRLRDIASLQLVSRSCHNFCRSSESQKTILPTFLFHRRWVDHLDFQFVEIVNADDSNFVTMAQNQEFAELLKSCSSLRELYCARNTRLDMRILAQGVKSCSQLAVLDVSHCRLALDDSMRWARPQKLAPLLAALRPRLRLLDLSYNLLGDDHAYEIVTALEDLTEATGEAHIEELLLRGNYLGNGAGHVFGQFMQSKAASCLWRLDMRTNAVEAEGACSLLTALQKHPYMREMRVGYNKQNKAEDLETAKLASVLLQKALGSKSNNKLEVLDLNNVRVGDTGARRIALALVENSLLRRLDLAFNSIGPEGAEAFASALEKNYTLQELDLRDNELGDEGACALAKGLRQNSGLKRVQLARNGIGPSGALALMQAIRENEELHIEFGASGDGSARLQGMLSRAPSLADLHAIREAEREFTAPQDTREQMTLMFAL
eukprot:TRINITY_DN27436_c0_g1_i1.p1 TRINITY_DN27436_c0_g1~~TRINITY_DN27436_c0_g1_i1.p1  ORF type:complete len:650 (+),score=136.78 TRINITY_DN27436_c0_g1_i1:61-2010(+)